MDIDNTLIFAGNVTSLTDGLNVCVQYGKGNIEIMEKRMITLFLAGATVY